MRFHVKCKLSTHHHHTCLEDSSMKPAIIFPQYALAVWTLCTPLVVGVIEWFISRHQRSELTNPAGRPGYAD